MSRPYPFEAIRFRTAGDYELAGLYGKGDSGAPGLVCCHGMLSSKESEKALRLAESLAAEGVASLRFDFSGRGESGGDPRRILYSQEVADLVAAAAEMRRRGHRRLLLFGSSMGGAVAVLFAAADPDVAGVVTLSGVSRPGRLLEHTPPEELAHWRGQGYFVYDGHQISAEYLADAAGTDVLGAARRLSCPLLVLHGLEDRVVPAEDGRLLAESGRGRLVEYPGADHRFSREEDLADALSRAITFYKERLQLDPRNGGRLLEALLKGHAAADEDEARDLEEMRRFAVSLQRPLSREEPRAHFTASAVVVDPRGERVCLVHHAKLNRWLQPGGHLEPEDAGSLVDAALREAREETGLDVRAHPWAASPLDVDIHRIPERAREASHLHLDVRFLLVARDPDALSPDPAESHGAQWVSWAEAERRATDSALHRLLGKARAVCEGPRGGSA